MTTQDLIDYYVNLLIIQYATHPKARATVAAFVETVIQDQIASQVGEGFGFSVTPGLQPTSAQGVQLDAVASYRGAQRKIYGLDISRPYLTMPFYGDAEADNDYGFALYGQTPINWYFLTYDQANALIYQLNDSELYRLTQLRAQTQSNLLSMEIVDDILFEFFGDNVAVFEDSPMKITYIDLLSDPDTLFGIAAASNSLPRPAGVQMTIIRSETLTEFFGFQIYGESNNPTFVGFGIYGSPQSGSFVRYG